MAMIQGIDGMALINALRAGREDRYSDQQRAMDMRAKQTDAQMKQQRAGLIGQLFSGQPQGVTGMASSSPQANMTPAPSMDTAFTPSAMSAIGGMDQGGAAPAPMVAQPAPQAAPQRASYDPDVLRKLVILDPETGGKIAKAFNDMDEGQIKQHQAQNDAMGLAAHYLSQYPEAQRPQMLQHVMPMLVQAGIKPEQITQANLSDDGLKGYQGMAIDFDKMVDNELARREFEAGKVVTPQPGASALRVMPDGRVETLIAGNDGTHRAGEPVNGGPATPKSKAEFDALPPGALFIDPNGIQRTKPGGPTPSASGGF
jgi:hypothetical protein